MMPPMLMRAVVCVVVGLAVVVAARELGPPTAPPMRLPRLELGARVEVVALPGTDADVGMILGVAERSDGERAEVPVGSTAEVVDDVGAGPADRRLTRVRILDGREAGRVGLLPRVALRLGRVEASQPGKIAGE